MFKKLFRSVREYKKESLFSPFFMIGEVAMECLIPLFTARLINSIQTGSDMQDIMHYAWILIGMALLSMTCGMLSGWFAATASAGFSKNLRHDLYDRVKDFSFANIDDFSSSSLVTRLTTDVANVQMAYMMVIRIAVRAPMMLIFSIIMAVNLGGNLAFTFVAVIPILGCGLLMIARKALPVFRAVFKKYDKLNESVEENVRGMRVVKSFVREDYEKQKFAIAAGNVKKDFTKAEKILAFNNPLMLFAIDFCMLVIPFFAARLIVSSGGSSMMIGNLSSLMTYSMQILMSLMMLSMIFVMFTFSIESARRITEVIDTESTIKNPENPVTEVKDGSIDFENVDFKYSEGAQKFALSDINLHIASGQTVGIIGGTGSSKTTLIQLIPRLYDVTDGTVRVGGIDVRDYDLKTLRHEVSVVLQKNVLFSGTIKDNVRWGKEDATDEEIYEACRLAQADEYIQSFPDKYDKYIEQGGANVSGGQKQRLCIARALIAKPKILILDDSTSAVDTKTDALIRKAFAEEIPDTTKIIIAQRVASVEDADMIIVMDNGTISDTGTHEELLERSPIYREVYESQTKGGEEDA
ncbi:MAG: ABC transporter ATP-binding protein [Oscillospiraceae bacterium]|nr:ABC transporter ATP-binding protein [Oscillospiraceae bacterium]